MIKGMGISFQGLTIACWNRAVRKTKAEPTLSKISVILLLAWCTLSGLGLASSRTDSISAPPLFLDRPLPFAYAEALVYPWRVLGEGPAITDFDGDNKADIAISRWSGNQYGIFIHLSSRAGATVLRSSTRLAGFALLAVDINKDRFSDIIVTNPTAPHPIAVWLGDGKGGFTVADQTRFDNEYGLTTSSSYKSQSFLIQQNLLPGPPRPVFEKPSLILGDSGPESNGFITYKSIHHPLQNEQLVLKLRSPPILIHFECGPASGMFQIQGV